MEHRSAKRVAPPEALRARLKAGVPVRVLDVSTRGVQLEVPHPLPVRSACELRFLLDQGEILVRATVKRCRVWGRGSGGEAPRGLLYRAGLEFERPFPSLLGAMGVGEATVGLPGGTAGDTGQSRSFGPWGGRAEVRLPGEAAPRGEKD